METKKDNGVEFSAEVKINKKGFGKDIDITIRYIDLTNPDEWNELQTWLIQLRASLVGAHSEPDSLSRYCNSIHQPRRSWDTLCSGSLHSLEALPNQTRQ